MNFCNFIQQRLRADDFQIPPHRQAVAVMCHFMTTPIKFILLSWTILSAFPSIGQSLKIDTFKTLPVDTSSIVRWQCHAGPSVFAKDIYPLIIINGKTFKKCFLQNIFFDFDTSTLSRLHVLNAKNDSIKLYGNAGKNGVIFITTKKPIEWISISRILKQKSNEILSTHKKTLIKIDNAFFETDEVLYFQKNLIDNISVANNATHYYHDKQFSCVVTISITKKSGT